MANKATVVLEWMANYNVYITKQAKTMGVTVCISNAI